MRLAATPPVGVKVALALARRLWRRSAFRALLESLKASLNRPPEAALAAARAIVPSRPAVTPNATAPRPGSSSVSTPLPFAPTATEAILNALLGGVEVGAGV